MKITEVNHHLLGHGMIMDTVLLCKICRLWSKIPIFLEEKQKAKRFVLSVNTQNCYNTDTGNYQMQCYSILGEK